MRSRRLLAFASIFLCALALAVASCSSSPKSGKKKRTILLIEADDVRVGREASRDVAAQIGILEDQKLEAYVSRIGHKLLRGMPRRSFQYHFSVVDQLEPNAFALPGGYIFISRGLLALTNNEDELANVIGHEITHSAHRHSAAQQELQRVGPLAMPWNRAANLAAYGRDMEREADRGGQMLAAASGYDPIGMSSFLKNLGQVERLMIGYARVPTFFDTHPGTRERAASNAFRASEIRWKRDPALGDTRAIYLNEIDGLPLGQRPATGIFDGDRFIHPALDFQLLFPRGWRTSNSAQAVGAVSPRGDAVVFLTADQPAGDPKEVAEAFVKKTIEEDGIHIDVKKSQPVKIGRIDAWRMELEGRAGGGSLTAVVTFIPYGGATWRIMGVSPSRSTAQYMGRILNTTRSFRPLGAEELRSLHTMNLRIARARAGEGLEALSQRTGNAWDLPRTAINNGIFLDHRFQGGELVKIAAVKPYVPPSQ